MRSRFGVVSTCLLFVVSGCANGANSEEAPDASVDASAARAASAERAPSEARHALPIDPLAEATTASLRRDFAVRAASARRVAPVLVRSDVARFEREGEAIAPMFDATIGAQRVARETETRLPMHADGELVLRAGDAELHVTPIGAAASEARVAKDAVVYPGALLGGDVVHVPSRIGTEEFVRLPTRPAHEELRYAIDWKNAAGLRLVEGSLELLGEDGDPLFHTRAPVVVDRDGKRIEGTIDVEGCAVDRDPRPPWGRPVTAAGAGTCTVVMRWDGAALAYPALVDPLWTNTSSMATRRSYHSANFVTTASGGCTVGCVVVVGGLTEGLAGISTAEVFNSSTKTWTTIASLPDGARGEHVGLLYEPGKIVIAGGETGSGGTFPTATQKLDVAAGTWSSGGALPFPGRANLAGVSIAPIVGYTIRALLAGGWDTTFTPQKNVAYFNGTSWVATNPLATARAWHAMEVYHDTGGYHVVVAGGSALTSVEIGTLVDGFSAPTWTAGPSLGSGRSVLGSAQLAGVIMFAGGGDSWDSAVADLDVYDKSLHTMAYHPGALSAGGEGIRGAVVSSGSTARLIFTGGGYSTQNGGGTFNNADVFDGTSTRLAVTHMNAARQDHTATALPDGSVLVAGGDWQDYYGNVSLIGTDEIYQPYANGTACTGNADCMSLLCVDGVCCDSACTGQCQACNTVGNVGKCTTVTLTNGPSGYSPGQAVTGFGTTRPGCAGYGTTCGTHCDGYSATTCDNVSNGTQCTAQSCSGNTLTSATACQSGSPGIAGYCSTATTSTCSGNLRCNATGTACLTSCTQNTDCISGFKCSSGTCVNAGGLGSPCSIQSDCASPYYCVDGACCGSSSCPVVSGVQTYCGGPGQPAPGYCKWKNGAACTSTSASTCGSGYCTDGYCCNQACGGQCQACDITPGACALVTTGQPHNVPAARTACAGSGACQAQCDGTSPTACGAFPSTATVCQASTCTGTTFTPTEYCNGLGGCATQSSGACAGNFECGAGGVCKSSCTTATETSDCASGYYCASNACVPKEPNGAACSASDQCTSGNCVDGSCCSTSSCTAPLKCNANGLGTCSKPNGVACTSPSECGSGNCVDGVCCNQACAGQCQACDVTGSVGACTTLTSGQPHGSRTKCSGSGACQAQCAGNPSACGAFPNTTTVCRASTCSATTFTPTEYCDGNGACVAQSSTTCGAFQCGTGGVCKSSCTSATSSTDCASGYFCSGSTCVTTGALGTYCTAGGQCSSGNCVNDACCSTATCASGLVCNANPTGTCSKPNGATCASGSECGSGNCVDGVCCDKPCNGQCEACDVAGSVGTCTPVAGTPHGTRTACVGTGVCQAQCDGSNRIACGAPPGTSTVCAAASCAGGVGTSTSYCDGLGNCASASSSSCGAYVCGGAACKTSCATSTDCASGYYCSGTSCVPALVLGKTCTADGQCASGHCVDGACCASASCTAPLTCNADASGTCKKPLGTACTLSNECGSSLCVDGYCCDKACDGQCEACNVAGSVGTCSPVVGQPHGTRTACSGTGVCQAQCDGSNRLACGPLPGTATPCASATCASGMATPARYCDGLGACASASPSACGAYVCGPSSCLSSCLTNSDCASGYFCSSGTCVTTGALGSVCTAATQCASGNCVDGVCCSVTSCASPNKCSASGNGTCAKPLATSCTADAECGSGHCVDGVCCDKTCAGECEACDVGGSVGTCSPVAGAPHGTRTACTGSGVCQAQCDGSNRIACGAPPGTSTSCGAASCAAGVSKSIVYCDGAGNCGTPTTKACAPYVCDTNAACKSVCLTTADCASGYACKDNVCVTTGSLGTTCTADDQCASGHCTANAPDKKVCCVDALCPDGSACADATSPTPGTCVKKNGQACTKNEECAAGYCVDGYCCDGACTGQCEACDIKGLEGKCSGVSGAPHGSRTACASGGGDVCKALACDGTKDHTKCSTYANGLETQCVAPSCTNGIETSAATCDGAGTCKTPTTTSCGGYACGATTCKTSCSADTDCAPNYQCSGGKCTPHVTATCSDDGTQSIPSGADAGPPQNCAPYRCTSTGACGTSCATTDDCLSGYTCDTSAEQCVPVTPGASSSGGCGCEQAGAGTSNGGWALAGLGLLAVLGRAKRKRA